MAMRTARMATTTATEAPDPGGVARRQRRSGAASSASR